MEGPNREIEWHMVDDELFRHLNGWLAGARRIPRRAGYRRADRAVLADRRPGPGRHADGHRVRVDLAGHPEGRLLTHPGADRRERDGRPRRCAGRGARPQGTAGWRSRPRRRRLGRGVRPPRPDRRVPALRPPYGDRAGTPMLRPSDAKVSLQLIETQTFGNGVVMLRYEGREVYAVAAAISRHWPGLGCGSADSAGGRRVVTVAGQLRRTRPLTVR